MLKFFALLTGDNYNVLQQHGPKSRKKVVVMGMGLTLVTGYWLVVGGIIGTQVLEMSLLSALLLALVSAGIVFGLDRSIVMSNGASGFLVGTRIALAVILSVLGGTALDLGVLDGEIDQELVAMHREATADVKAQVGLTYATSLADQQRLIANASSAYEEAERNYLDEINGSYKGSGRYGVGPVANEKKELVEQRAREVSSVKDGLMALQAERAKDIDQAVASLEAAQIQATLFERVHAMHSYVCRDNVILVSWVLFTLLLIGFELFPVIAKCTAGRTSYDEDVEIVDELQRQRTRTVAHIQRELYAHRQRMSETERDAMRTLTQVLNSERALN